METADASVADPLGIAVVCLSKVAGFKSECRPASFGTVAGFKSEWWPASSRYRGRLRVGIPGRIKSESASDHRGCSSATATVGDARKFVRSRNPVTVIVKIESRNLDRAPDMGCPTQWAERDGSRRGDG